MLIKGHPVLQNLTLALAHLNEEKRREKQQVV
jgi:hypothetical protein